MAFQKLIENSQTGVKSVYWRLVGINIDVLNARAQLSLAGYTSASIRGKPDGMPVDQRVFQIDQAAFTALFARHLAGENLSSLSYEYIATAPRMTQFGPQPGEFADAEKV